MNKSKRLFFTGFAMGVADLIPGVSGGTVAFLLGIYDELLYTIKLLTGEVPVLLMRGQFKRAFYVIPFSFVVPVALGIVLAIFGLVHVVSFLLEEYTALVWALFFGLVLGSTYVVSHRVTRWTFSRVLLLVCGFVVTFVIVGLPALSGNPDPIAIFATGALAITAMILPGISGALIMVLLGQYEIIIHAIAGRDLATLLVFAGGIFFGLALFVRLLLWLLRHYHSAVIAFLMGVMAGSLRRIWPLQDYAGTDTVGLLWILGLCVLGFAIVVALERAGIASEHEDISTPEFKKAVTG